MLLLTTTIGLAAAAASFALQRKAARYDTLRSTRTGLLTVELRRRALVTKIADDLQEFPQPREFRVRVWRLAGVPLWWREQYASLPQHLDSQVHLLRATDFDHLFGDDFRLDAAGGRAATTGATAISHA